MTQRTLLSILVVGGAGWVLAACGSSKADHPVGEGGASGTDDHGSGAAAGAADTGGMPAGGARAGSGGRAATGGTASTGGTGTGAAEDAGGSAVTGGTVVGGGSAGTEEASSTAGSAGIVESEASGSAGAGETQERGGSAGATEIAGTAGAPIPGGAAGAGGTVSPGGSAGDAGTGLPEPAVTVTKLDTLGSSGWGAWQDGDGHWQEFPTTEGDYTFTPTSSRYGVATVGCKNGSVPFVNVQYRTTAVTLLSACDRVPQRPSGGIAPCSGAGVPPTISGVLTNVGTSGWLDIAAFCPYSGFGRQAITSAAGSATYSVETWLPNDFLFAIADAEGQPFSRIAMVRGVDVNSVDIDFATDGAPTETMAFTITGLAGSDAQSHSITWQTTGGMPLFFEATTNAIRADDTYSAVDSSLVEPGDAYTFSANAKQGGGTDVQTELWGQFVTPADIAFPVSFVSATASVAASAPYGRVQVEVGECPGAQHYAMEAYGQVVNGNPTVQWWVDATPDWFTGAAPYRLAMPNLDSANGWDNAKGFTSGSRATIVAFTSIQSPLSDGSQTIVGKRTGLSAIP